MKVGFCKVTARLTVFGGFASLTDKFEKNYMWKVGIRKDFWVRLDIKKIYKNEYSQRNIYKLLS